ncbi:MAG: SpoIIIAH-like family protein [Bacilli bacterium]|nr:SpoIIIAH-like family protein [Bacilli bacterium]
MNKQNLLFVTLFSLILVLSVYYVTMPNDLLLNANSNYLKKDDLVSVVVDVDEAHVDVISALRINKEEERISLQSDYQSILTNNESTSDEKNEALEKIKSLNENATLETSLEDKIKSKYNLECCVEIDSLSIVSTCSSSNHDNILANNIMRSIQEEFDSNKYITVKFET